MVQAPDGGGGLSVRVERSGSTVTARLEGALDLNVRDEFSSCLMAQIDDTVEHITVDVSKLGFCDFSGLEAIATAGRHASALGATLQLQHPRQPLLDLIGAAGLDHVLGVSPPTS